METFCEKKIREKLRGKKLQGGLQQPPPPLSRLRVKIKQSLDERIILQNNNRKPERNLLTKARQKTASTGIYFVKYIEI